MNPTYGLWDTDAADHARTPLRVRLVRAADRAWLDGWREGRALLRSPSRAPPRDPETWLAWANGADVPGPRWERYTDAALAADVARRREERAAAEALAAELAKPALGPWEYRTNRYAPRWVRCRPGRTTPVAEVCEYKDRRSVSASASVAWSQVTDGDPYEFVGWFKTVDEARDDVDERLVAAGVRLVEAA